MQHGPEPDPHAEPWHEGGQSEPDGEWWHLVPEFAFGRVPERRPFRAGAQRPGMTSPQRERRPQLTSRARRHQTAPPR
jgi:hypothetical protein